MSKPLAVACCVGLAIVFIVTQWQFFASENSPAAPREYAKSGDTRMVADWTEEDEKYEIARVYQQRGSVNLLPSHVLFSEGQFSIYADFDHALRDSVPLYVINCTREALQLAYSPDYDLKLEVCDGKREWKRAQPHAYSWCGNSYGSTPILPGEFLVTEGYKPKSGRMARVRYRLYDETIEAKSNIGDGLVSNADVRLASRDAMSVPDWPLDLIERVALGEQKIKNEVDHNDLRKSAIYALASKRFSQERRDQILHDIQTQGNRYSSTANHVVQRLKDSAETEQ